MRKKTRVLGPFKGCRQIWVRFARIGKGSSSCCPSLHADLCPPPKTMRPHQACPFGAGRGSQPAIRFPLFLKAGLPKNTLFWRNRAFFPVASRSNPRCSKAQIASYLAQIRRFLAPTAWASSTSTTKKISLQATQAWFRKGSRRLLVFLDDGWKRAVAVPDMLAAPSVETIQWHTHGRNRASTYPMSLGL